MSTGSPGNTIEDALQWLRNLPDLEELRRQVGDLTSEERDRLGGVANTAGEVTVDQELLDQWTADLNGMDVQKIGMIMAMESHVGIGDEDKSPSAESVEDISITFVSLLIQGFELGLSPVSAGLAALTALQNRRTLAELVQA